MSTNTNNNQNKTSTGGEDAGAVRSPSKEELPVLANPLKTELVGEHHLKHVPEGPKEKVVLPSAQQIQEERNQNQLFQSIHDFQKESRLKETETEEKNVLPTRDQIEAEKQKK